MWRSTHRRVYTGETPTWHTARHGLDLEGAPRTPARRAHPTNVIDRYFKITERGSTIGTEIRGGLVTFFTMSYIIVLNPIILGGKDGTGDGPRADSRPSPRPRRSSPAS